MAQDEDVVISPTNWVADQAKEYAESNGTRGTDMNGSPCLLLDYKGRKSGKRRRTVLIFGRDGDDYLIVASRGGADNHPVWYLNLQADPDVAVQVYGDRFKARAETLSSEEKARVWPHLVDVYAPYADYQKKTTRDIPVVRLRRVEG
jgi:F420H(2)-dependent quinone reductase